MKIVQFQIKDSANLKGVAQVYALDDSGQLWMCSLHMGKQSQWRAFNMNIEGAQLDQVTVEYVS